MTDLIDAYAEQLSAAGRSPNTIQSRRRILRRADRLMPRGLDGACGDDIRAYLSTQAERWSKTTVYSALRGYYRCLVDSGRLTINPTDHVQRPRAGDSTPNPVRDDELAAALARSPAQPWRAAVVLAAYAGLRCCEIVELCREHITPTRLRVRRGKGGRARTVPTHPLVWELAVTVPSGLVVRSVRGLPLTAHRIATSQYRHWRSVGLLGVHMHRFRHWFGTTLVDQGVGIEVVADLMGHASVDTTRGYVRASTRRHAAAMEALPILGAPAGS